MKRNTRMLAWLLALTMTAQTALPAFALETPAGTAGEEDLPVQPQELVEQFVQTGLVEDGGVLLATVTAGDYTYEPQDDTTCFITAYSGSEAQLTVPAVLDGYAVTGIGTKAFYGNAALVSVTLPDGMLEVGVQAFEDCAALETVVLPDSVTTLGRRAFADCSALTRVNYPAGLTSVPGNNSSSRGFVFGGCAALTEITVPEGVTAIPDYAFRGCESLETVNLPASLKSVGSNAFYGCTALKNAALPAGLETLGGSAFYGCTALEAVTVPGGVETVGAEAFRGCTALASVTLEQGVETVGSYAFYGCAALSQLTLNTGLTELEQYAFANCTALETAVLPDSITTLGRRAFADCAALTAVNYPTGLTAVPGSNSSSRGFVFTGCTALTEMTVPDGVTAIPDYAFRDCETLKTVHLPENLKTVGARAFYGCTGLTEITLPAGLETLGGSAFYGCTGLSEVTIPGSLTEMGTEAFRGCTGLVTVTLEEGVSAVSDYTFAGCGGLRTLDLPNGLLEVGKYAFSDCAALETVHLPDTVTDLGSSAFRDCAHLTAVNCPADIARVPGSSTSSRGFVFAGCTALRTVTVPQGLTALPDYLFRGCETLREVLLPESVTQVGVSAFRDCTALQKVYVPAAVNAIDDEAFSGCEGLTLYGVADSFAQEYAAEKDIPFTTDSPVAPVSGLAGLVQTKDGQPLAGVTVTLYHVEGGEGAFTLTTDEEGRWSTLQALTGETYRVYYYCPGYDITPQNREYVLGEGGLNAQTAIAVSLCDLPEGESGGFTYTVTNGTFCEITGYTGTDTRVRVPGQIDGYTVQSLAARLFRDRADLTAVVLPDTVETVGNSLFEGCTELEQVWLGNGLTATGDAMFKGCTALKTVVLPAGIRTLGADAFRGCTALERVVLAEGLESLGNYAFADCAALCGITLPDSLSVMGSRAFENCASLTAVNYPLNWTTCLGTNAYAGSRGSVFKNCPLLTTITVPEGVTAIPDYAFRGSGSLTEIILPPGLKTVGVSAFEELNITEMHLPASVETVGQEAFLNCTALKAFSAQGAVTLGVNALRGCTALREVALGDSLRTVSDSCFQGCTALVRLDLGEGVETVGLYAFADCTSLPSVTLPDSLTTLASRAFSGCTALKTVNYPVNWADCPSPNAYNGNQGFVFANTAVTEMTVPEGVTAVPAYAFRGCEGLAAVTLPGSLTAIGEYAFCGTALTQVDLPVGLKVLGNSAFADCAALKSVRAPFKADDDLETLGSGVLSNCGEDLTVWCCSASKMHYYAEEAGIAVALLDDHEHTMEETLRQEPVCEADGLLVTRCTVCGYERREVLARLGHDFETEYTVDLPASCARDGSRSRHCTRCAAVTDSETLPATGHLFGGWVVTTAPTVLAAGEMTRYCNYCDETETAEARQLALTADMLEDYGLVHFTVVHAQELTPVADAAISVETPEGEITFFTDEDGKASCVLPAGKLPAAVKAPGCKSRSLTLTVKGGEQELPAIGVSERDPVQVELKHHLMTYEEIIAAGIDPNAPGNNHVYRYELTITFIPVLDFIGLTYLFNESGHLLRFPEIEFPRPGGGDDGSSEHRDNTFWLGEPTGREDEYGPYHASFWHTLWNGETVQITVTEKFLLIIYGEVKWLKEMFDVEMVILNASETDTLENCEAELILPEGLSLATMREDREQQTLRQAVPTIPGGGTHTVHWYVRGDAEGCYDIAATLDGMLMPFEEEFHYSYVADEPIKVYAGSALHLTLEVEDVVYYGTETSIRIILQNVSDRTLYNVSSTVNNTVQKRVTYTTKEGKTTVSEELIGQDSSSERAYAIPAFHPGDQLIVEGTVEICFNAQQLKNRFKTLLDEMKSLCDSLSAISDAFDAGEDLIGATSDISDALDSGLISTDTIKASGSLSALTDYTEFKQGNATQSGGSPGFMAMLHDLVDSLPIRYVLEGVSVETLEDSTAQIPWTINTVPGPPVNPLIPAGSISMTKLIYSIAILLIDRQDVKVGGMTLKKDYTNTAEAYEYVRYCWQQTAAIRAADPSGETHWRTYYVAADTRTRSVTEQVTIEIDNETAVRDENGVWTFTGPAVIQVTPNTIQGGTLYVQKGDEEPKAYVIEVVEPHECGGSQWQVGVPATENTVGFRYQNCDVCGEMCNVESLRSCGDHTFAPWLQEVAPVNGYHGVETRTCAECGVLEYRFVAENTADGPAGLVTEASGRLEETDEGLCLVLPEGATVESLFDTLTQPLTTQRQDAEGTLLTDGPLATGQTLSLPGQEGQLTLVLPGDVDGDGLADGADADRALALAAGGAGDAAATLAADTDGDGAVTLADAANLALAAAGVTEAPDSTLLALYADGGQLRQALADPQAVPTGETWQTLSLFLLDEHLAPLAPAVTCTAQ